LVENQEIQFFRVKNFLIVSVQEADIPERCDRRSILNVFLAGLRSDFKEEMMTFKALGNENDSLLKPHKSI
jgi:hypothetical protein